MLFKEAREAREGLHLSKKYVCNYLKCNINYLNAIENGTTIPSKDELNKLKQLYGINNFENNDLSHDEKEIQNLIKFRNNFKSL